MKNLSNTYVGGKEFYEVDKKTEEYRLINAENISTEHYQNPTCLLGYLYKNITKDKLFGQEDAVFAITKVVRDHLLAIHDPEKTYVKINPLLIGPTGSGKTYAVQLAAELAGLAYVEFKMAQVTPLSIVGSEKLPRALERLIEKAQVSKDDVKKHLETLFRNNKIDEILYNSTLNYFKKNREEKFDAFEDAKWATKIFLAERGIIFLDEVDKIAYQGRGSELGTKEAVQNELMDYLGGSKVVLDERSGVEEKLKGKEIETKNILFFLAGAFSEIDSVLKGDNISIEKIRKYGIKPELLGRAGVPILFKPLQKDDLRRIVKYAKLPPLELSLRDQIILDLKKDFPSIDISEDAIEFVVSKAYISNLGARYLKSLAGTLSIRIVKKLLYNIGIEKRMDKVKIDAKFLENLIGE